MTTGYTDKWLKVNLGYGEYGSGVSNRGIDNSFLNEEKVAYTHNFLVTGSSTLFDESKYEKIQMAFLFLSF